MLHFSFHLSCPSVFTNERHTHLVWKRKYQNPASVARRWTSSWELSLECCKTRAWLDYVFVSLMLTLLPIIIIIIIISKGYLQHCRSFMSLKSPVSGSSLCISLLISLLISLCWRRRSSNFAVKSSQDLERESGWPGAKPTWFNMPSEQDIRFRFRLRPR